MKNSILILFVVFATTNIFCQDSTLIDIKAVTGKHFIFYETNSFAIAITTDEIVENRKYFEKELIRKIDNDTIATDTIWLNEFVKSEWAKSVETIFWNKLKSGKLFILNRTTNNTLEKIYYKEWNDGEFWYYQFYDFTSKKLIIERRNPWIGTPSF